MMTRTRTTGAATLTALLFAAGAFFTPYSSAQELQPASAVATMEQVKDAWQGKASLGLNSSSGNTDTLSVTADAEALRKKGLYSVGLKAAYNYAEDEGGMSARNAFGSARVDRAISERTYAAFTLELLNDKFKDIVIRGVAGPAIGYRFIETKERSLGAELGVSYLVEEHDASQDESDAVMRAQATYAQKLTETMGFKDQLVAYGRVDDLSDYQLRNEVSVDTALGASWAMKVSNVINYDSEAPAGVESTDVAWVAALQYSF